MSLHTSTCSAGSAASHSQRDELDLGPFASARLTHTPAQSCASTGQTFRTLEISPEQTSGPTQEQLFSPEDSLASRSALPGSERAREMTVSSGLRCSQLLKEQSPIGSLVRTLLASSEWNSIACLLTWNPKATPHGRLLFQLLPSTPDTAETAFGLWPTIKASDGEKCAGGHRGKADTLTSAVKLWPTQTVCEVEKDLNHYQERRARQRSTKGGGDGPNLATAVKLLPTPCARDHFPPHSKEYIQAKKDQWHGMSNLNDHVGGQLNPEWVEWLMGYPAGWTELSASEMPSCRRSRKSSSKESGK